MQRCQTDFFFSLWMGPEKKYKSVYFEWLVSLWNPHYPAVGVLFPVSVWIYDAIVENRFWNLKQLGFRLAAILHCICSSASVWMGFSSRSALRWSRYLDKESAQISCPRSSSTPTVQPSPNLSSTNSVSEPREHPSSPSPMWEPQVAMSLWVQIVWSTRVSCWAMLHMESHSFHPSLLLFKSTESWEQRGKHWAFSIGHFPLGIYQLQSAGQYNHRCLSCSLFSCWAEETWKPASTHPLLLDCFLLHWPFYAFLLTLPLCSRSHLCSAKSKP